MLRYLRRLADADLALDRTMIPLGSCTMKLNATTEMASITWPEFAGLHPYAPLDESAGLRSMIADLEAWLAEITGYDAVSVQPNAGSQGELAGLLAIRAYHRSRGDDAAHGVPDPVERPRHERRERLVHLANLILLLVSDYASAVTGQFVLADMGAHIALNRPASVPTTPDQTGVS